MPANYRLHCCTLLPDCALPPPRKLPSRSWVASASLGNDYRLSKRTDFYTVAMRDRITTLPSAMSPGAGVRHSF
jgi:hypothetical protein